MRVEILNHAAVRVDVGGIKLLSDPWFFGTCFAGGWRLEYDNPNAVEAAAQATHLWVSHWHSDHLHPATLKAIAAQNPDMCVLANVSDNFSMVDFMGRMGFRNIVELYERVPLTIDGATFTRYPTAGIDNMLHMTVDGRSVLNYNDCNLPRRALRALKRRIGRIDLLLNNYNHAGKLFVEEPPETVKANLWRAFDTIVEVLDPIHSVPFASSHYYAAPLSAHQNASLIDFDEVAAHASQNTRLIALRTGDVAHIDGRAVTVEPLTPALEPEARVLHDYGPTIPVVEVLAKGQTRCAELRKAFPGIAPVFPTLRVRMDDLDTVIEFSLRKGARVTDAPAHINCHSRALMDWVGRRFGDDTFLAGAHFGLVDDDTTAVRRWMLLATLEASELDIRRMARRMLRPDGVRFLANRREELLATVTGFRFKAGTLRI